jgi:hypothetical protein
MLTIDEIKNKYPKYSYTIESSEVVNRQYGRTGNIKTLTFGSNGYHDSLTYMLSDILDDVTIKCLGTVSKKLGIINIKNSGCNIHEDNRYTKGYCRYIQIKYFEKIFKYIYDNIILNSNINTNNEYYIVYKKNFTNGITYVIFPKSKSTSGSFINAPTDRTLLTRKLPHSPIIHTDLDSINNYHDYHLYVSTIETYKLLKDTLGESKLGHIMQYSPIIYMDYKLDSLLYLIDNPYLYDFFLIDLTISLEFLSLDPNILLYSCKRYYEDIINNIYLNIIDKREALSFMLLIQEEFKKVLDSINPQLKSNEYSNSETIERLYNSSVEYKKTTFAKNALAIITDYDIKTNHSITSQYIDMENLIKLFVLVLSNDKRFNNFLRIIPDNNFNLAVKNLRKILNPIRNALSDKIDQHTDKIVKDFIDRKTANDIF